MSSTIIPATEAREKLTSLMEEVEQTNNRVIITKKGRAKVALISLEELEGWEETLDILRDEAEVASIRRGLKDIKEGRLREWK